MKKKNFARLFQSHLLGLSGQSTYLSQDTFTYMDGSAGVFYAHGIVVPESDFRFVIMMNSKNEDAVEFITMHSAKAEFNWWWMVWI